MEDVSVLKLKYHFTQNIPQLKRVRPKLQTNVVLLRRLLFVLFSAPKMERLTDCSREMWLSSNPTRDTHGNSVKRARDTSQKRITKRISSYFL
ncbi:hypothetical protein TERTU_0713 [Teredinibacter turnerae T7901]|uniref:Uncharacterized protein n=1 Tax=Teredinibacter turnerae (strain ATCC 39867 / T7901) TaxID=377629 RepID=C5BNX7_TERTT|nr:hypothetical protein TERTU_0713 [Teredinibacter turnerae T7901]